MLLKIPAIFEHHQIELVSVLSFCLISFFPNLKLNAPLPSPYRLFFNAPQAQRDGHKLVIQLIGPEQFCFTLHMDYAVNYSHIKQIMSQQNVL